MSAPSARALLFVLLGFLAAAAADLRAAPAQAAPGGELLFRGRSSTGDLQEALDAALDVARTELAKHSERLDFAWELTRIGGRATTEPTARELGVTVRITRGVPPALQKKAGPGGAAGGGGF